MAKRARLWNSLAGLLGLAAALAGSPVEAADPAVSDSNLKLSFFGGNANAGATGVGIGGLAGSLTLPVGHAFGIQLDGAVGKVDGNGFYGAGGHLFWRDPGQGLFGLYAGYAKLEAFGGQSVRRFGLEAERFIGNFTLRGAGGIRDGAGGSSAYGSAKLDYYWTPNLKTSSGVTFEGTGFYSSSAEYQFNSDEMAGMSLYYDSNYHASDSYQILGGLKISFGKSMSLIDRHRKQDPDMLLGLDLIATEQAAAKYCSADVAYALPQTCMCPPFTIAIDGGDNTFSCHEPMK